MTSLGSRARSLFDAWQVQGPAAAEGLVVDRCLRPLNRIGVHFFDFHHYRCPLPTPVSVPTPKLDITIEDFAAHHVELIRPLVEAGKAELFLARLSRGVAGLVCLHEQRVIYFTWYTTRDESDPTTGTMVSLKPGEGYVFDSFCSPEYRGHGVNSFMNSVCLRRLSEMGCDSALGRVHTLNFSSRWAISAAGFTPVGRVTGLNVGRRSIRIARKPALLRWERTPTRLRAS